MSKGILALVAILLAAMTAYCAYYGWATSKAPGDGDEWLQSEFGLSDESLAKVQTASDAYLPKCQAMCERLAKAREELAVRTGADSSIPAEIAEAYSQVNAIEEECVHMSLTHVFEVASFMPEAQGNRYRKRMVDALTSDRSAQHQRHSDVIRGGRE
ncbi:MAG: hypothetical protein ACI8T1_001450 [Verrucomicrobiales bacterium]|jgi:hypothetical protein